MKIQHISIIFIIIMVPVLLVLQYYLDLQSDTLLLQAEYDEKLVSATKQALEAFEINTVEWNSETSDLSDSLRRDINASVNVFVNSMANNLGVGGTSRELILSYIPAVAFTLNDGYYIYTPTYVPITAKDENGLTKKNENGEILYKKKNSYTGETTTSVADAQTEYKHVLKTFVPYQKQLGNYIFNFSLDNYVKVYAKVGVGENEEIIKRSGHYQVFQSQKDTYPAEPEILTENIVVNNDGIYEIENYKYVYDQHGEKLYCDEFYLDENGKPTFFTLDSNAKKNYLVEVKSEEDIGYRYKTLLEQKENSDYMEYKTFYQGLNGERKGKWFVDGNLDGYLETNEEVTHRSDIEYGIYYDFSARNYYVETIAFTRWVRSIKNDLNAEEQEEFNKIFDYGDLTTNSEKRKIIRESIETNLQLAMSTYTKYSGNKYELPYFKEVEWERIYSNISIITFFEGAPIGLKTYSNYAIETSTNNNAYVSEDCLYLVSDADQYYHKYFCDKFYLGSGNRLLSAYKNTDFVMQTKIFNEGNTIVNYYKHANPTDTGVEDACAYACYYCLVSDYEYEKSSSMGVGSVVDIAWARALAREKYVNSVIIYDFNQEIEEINPFSQFVYQIWYNGKAVAGADTIEEVFAYTDSNLDKDFTVIIKNNISGTLTDNTQIRKNGNNTVTIDFSSNGNIDTYVFNNVEQPQAMVSDVTVKINQNQTVNINSNIYIKENSLKIEGEGQLNTGKLIARDGARVQSADKIYWVMSGGIRNEASSTIEIGKAEINVDANNYIKLNSFTSKGGDLYFDSANILASGGTHTINIKEFKSYKIDCLTDTKLEILAQEENSNMFSVNQINNQGTINIYDNIEVLGLYIDNISNNSKFTVGVGTGDEGKNFSCTNLRNNGEVNIQNNGDFSFGKSLINNGKMNISNKGNFIEGNDAFTNTGELTIANIGNVYLSYNGISNTGTAAVLNIEGARTIESKVENTISASGGSTTNIKPGIGNTIKFVNEVYPSGNIIKIISASEHGNNTTTWKERTTVNINDGKLETNAGGILHYGGQLKISNATIEMNGSGATHIIQSALESAHENARAYPRISIKDSKLTLATEREDNVAIAVEQGILQIENSTINSDACGIQTFLSNWDTSIRALHQKPSGYGDGDWYRSVNNNNIEISDRTELPIVVIDNSTISTKNYAILHGFGYVQATNSTIKRETSGEGNDADSDVWLYYSAGGYMKTVLMYDQSSSNFYFSVPDFNTGFKKYSPSNSPGPGNMITFNLERTTISTYSQKEFSDVILNLPINH